VNGWIFLCHSGFFYYSGGTVSHGVILFLDNRGFDTVCAVGEAVTIMPVVVVVVVAGVGKRMIK
jgi:hypothetical protein